MESIARLFGPKAEAIGAYMGKGSGTISDLSESDLLAIIQRHPCSLADIATTSGVAEKKLRPILENLIATGRAKQLRINAGTAYIAIRPGNAEKKTAG